MVQGLRLCASTAEGMGSIPGQGTKDPVLFMAVAPPPQKNTNQSINILGETMIATSVMNSNDPSPVVLSPNPIDSNY